jgi:hypothetical protein
MLMSLVVAFLFMSVVIAPGDDSPAIGLAWFMLAVPLAALLAPVGLGFTAGMIERKSQRRRFRWLKALCRSLLGIPIVLGPVHTVDRTDEAGGCCALNIEARRWL